MSVVDLNNQVQFEKSIIINHSQSTYEEGYITGSKGQLRFNNANLKFEGYHSPQGTDIFGNAWRPLTQDIASASNLGIIRVGSNLTINPATGVLSSIATGVSRIYQLVITVSPIPGAADYQSINTAIHHAIGTLTGGYIDGSITSLINSAPSSIYPFIIQLSPGEYTETLNQIVLPNYVSIRGEDNYNSIIIQNVGNVSITTGSMIIIGDNCEVGNLVVKLSDISSSAVSNAIFALNKSNVSIDSCILTCQTNLNTTSNTSCIYMDGGLNNSITNCQFLINSSNITGNITSINILNTCPRIINNKINILAPLTSLSLGISLNDTFNKWDGTESILDKTYIEKLTLSNNYNNTISGGTNIGIYLNNCPVTITNSDIEVSTDSISLNTSNYGIEFSSLTSLLECSSSNIISFVNTELSNNTIISNNISIINFTTLKFQRGQYILISGSQLNNGVYKIASVISSSILLIDYSYQIITEPNNISNTIIIKALYNVEIHNTKIITYSTNDPTLIIKNATVKNNDGNNNYLFNINNVVNVSQYNIQPSFVFYDNYKTITVGKANCDYQNLVSAVNSINDNSLSIRYLIKIASGIYQENSVVICKEYVNIEGNGENNTTLLFYQSSNVSTTDSSCILLCSNMKLYGITIKNASYNYSLLNDISSFVLYNPLPITNVILENINIESVCSSYYNTGIHLVSAINNIVLRNVNITVYSNMDVNFNVGIYNNLCSDISYYNISIIVGVILGSPNSSYNYALSLEDSECNIYNSTLISSSGILENYAIKTHSTNLLHQNLVSIYNSCIKTTVTIDYSIYAGYNYTIICNNVQLFGDTYTSSVASRIFCIGCYTFDSELDKLGIQSINSRGQNEQTAYNTITIGDSAGKLNSNGLNNVIIGVQAGSNLTTGESSTIIGSHAGQSITTAINNTLLGSHTGQSITNGNYNTISGTNAGYSLTSADNNLISGDSAGYSLTTGGSNTILGAKSAYNLKTGINNTFIGYNSAYNSNTASRNTFVGYAAGDNNETGDDNIYLGYQSGHANIIGNNNLLIGKQSGYTNISNGIVSIGNSAGYNNTNSIKNTYLGTNSGFNNTTGNCNTYIGNNTGYGSIAASGAFNIAIGNETGYSLTSGSRNVLIGATSSSNGLTQDSAGWSLTDGIDNIHIGVGSGSNASSTINNVLIGTNSGSEITAASNNVLIGSNTGSSLSTIGQNVIIGSNAGNTYTAGSGIMIGYNAGALYSGAEAFAIGYQAGSNVSGEFNMFIGYNSGGLPKSNTTGSNNLAIGPYTGFNLLSGTRNVLIGGGDSVESVGRQLSTGSDNTLIGFKAGKAIQTGIGNTLIGSNAGSFLTSGVDNLILGYQSAYKLNSGSYNVILGPYSGYNLTTGIGNIYSGYKSGFNNTTGSYNINMGYQSGYTSTVNTKNIHIGYNSGYSSIANNNLFMGYQSGLKNTIGTNNIFIGSDSGAGNNTYNAQIGANNIFVGNKSGTSNNNGYSNIFMGSNTGASCISGSKNIFIGENAGSSGQTVSHNIFIGSASNNNDGIGSLTNTTGQYNVFVGTDVGIANTTGSNNIFLGNQAGRNNTTGIQNIYLGINAGRDSNGSTSDNNIAIGSDAGINNQTGQDNILIGKSVAGLATSINYNKNIIIGSDAGQNIQQDNQIFIGTNAGKLNTTGDRNIFIGLNTGYANVVSDDNIVIGSNAGVSLIGNGLIGDNVIIGSDAGHDLTTGTNNIYIGSNTGSNASTSVNNVVIGANAMSNGDCSNTIIIGYNAGHNNTIDNNMFIGTECGYSNNTGYRNLGIGYQALYTNISSSDNLSIGYRSGRFNSLGTRNLCIGSYSGESMQNNNNIAIGYNSMSNSAFAFNNTCVGINTGLSLLGESNIFMGAESGLSSTYANYNVCIGVDTMRNNTSGSNNVCIGYQAGNKILVSNNIYIGYQSGNTNQNGINNVAIGSQSSFFSFNCNNNVAIGATALYNNETGEDNVCIGYKSLYNNTYGTKNICIGNYAGMYSHTDNNIYIGFESGHLTFYGINNQFIGTQSGHENASGNYNNFCGYKTGYNSKGSFNTYIGNSVGQLNDGSNNFFMGYETIDNTSALQTTFSNKFAIYNNSSYGITSNTTTTCNILIGGEFNTGIVGIGTITPSSWASGSLTSFSNIALVVLGKVLANSYISFTGAHKVFIDKTTINTESESLLEGMIMSSTGIIIKNGISDTIVTVKTSNTNNDKKIYGIYSGFELIQIDNSNNTNINYYVNSIGEGCVLITNINGEIQNGDYITTCPIAGYGALQSDDILHSYTVAKCTENIDWITISDTIKHNGILYKTYLSGCTYHCG